MTQQIWRNIRYTFFLCFLSLLPRLTFAHLNIQIVVADASVFGPSGLLDEHLHHFNDLCRQVSSKLIVYEIRGSAALIFEDLLDSYQFLEGTSNHVPKPVYCIDVDKSKQDTLNIWTDHTRNVNSASKIRFIKVARCSTYNLLVTH